MTSTMLAILLMASPDSASAHSTRVRVAEGETLHVSLRGVGYPVLIIPGLFGAVEGFSRVRDSLVACLRLALLHPELVSTVISLAVEPWPLGAALERITCPVVLVQGLAPHEGGPNAEASLPREHIGREGLLQERHA